MKKTIRNLGLTSILTILSLNTQASNIKTEIEECLKSNYDSQFTTLQQFNSQEQEMLDTAYQWIQDFDKDKKQTLTTFVQENSENSDLISRLKKQIKIETQIRDDMEKRITECAISKYPMTELKKIAKTKKNGQDYFDFLNNSIESDYQTHQTESSKAGVLFAFHRKHANPKIGINHYGDKILGYKSIQLLKHRIKLNLKNSEYDLFRIKDK